MSLEPVEYGPTFLPVPPFYEPCVAEAIGPRADYVASPLEIAALFDWDEDEYD